MQAPLLTLCFQKGIWQHSEPVLPLPQAALPCCYCLTICSSSGTIFPIVLQHDGERVAGLKTERLGRVSAPSTLTYLDNGVVYVGSSFGDSQLVRRHISRS